MNYSHLRKEYLLKKLDEAEMHHNPMEQLKLWLEEAIQLQMIEPTAMSLATCTKAGCPSCRLVLLRHIDWSGIIFFTNLESRKVHELEENPLAAATFWWGALERQVRLEGRIEKIAPEIAAAYFAKRPRTSQLGAWASAHQSHEIPSREFLEEQLKKYGQKFQNQEVPLPPFWGGFKLIPSKIEFWQGRENRLHDRLLYTKIDSTWLIKRLSP